MVERSAVNRNVAGSSPAWGVYAHVAQLAEQLICNQQVNGSSPFMGFFFVQEWTFFMSFSAPFGVLTDGVFML